jgi:hypothetical protein
MYENSDYKVAKYNYKDNKTKYGVLYSIAGYTAVCTLYYVYKYFELKDRLIDVKMHPTQGYLALDDSETKLQISNNETKVKLAENELKMKQIELDFEKMKLNKN